ncbi:MAG: hypothetical protein HPAVJP_3350 [Candidatus Hepatoplasma vulgare]|nr:MAG: hypothetical protein HPAVJP_3350 [Candidatus Hepatoplasma sp.]
MKYKKLGKQDIIVKYSPIYKFMQRLLVFLHFLLAVFTILVLIGVVFKFQDLIEIIIESITFVIIVLILAIIIAEPIIKRHFIKKIFGKFWGDHLIETKLMRPKTFKIDENQIFGRIVEVDSYIQNENIQIRWKKRFSIFSDLWVSVELQNEKGNHFKYDFIIDFIIVNLDSKRLTISAKLMDEKTNIIQKRPFIWNFDLKRERARWSGLLPGHPNYGEWIWSSVNKKEDIKEDVVNGDEFNEKTNPIID